MNRGRPKGESSIGVFPHMEPLTDGQRATVAGATGIVHFVLKTYRGRDYEDAYQNGLIGLMRAVQTWDPERGALSTWAKPWIWTAVRRGEGLAMGVSWRQRHEHSQPVSLDL